MSKDLALAQELRPIEDRYLEMAEDKVYFARQMLLRWQEQADNLERLTRRSARTPSGTFAGVSEALSRARTEAKNPLALLEEARAVDVEHRPTPVVPDARRDPE